MYADALVLNQNYQAIHVIGWKRVMALLFTGQAEAVDDDLQAYNFEDWAELSSMMKDHPAGFVESPTMRIAVPEVIRLTKYNRLPKRDVKFTRRNIYEHYGYKCSYCAGQFATAELNLDHVVPKSRGGRASWENTALSCIPCNSKKANRTPEEAGMKLLVAPAKPKWQGIGKTISLSPMKVRVSWQKLIDRAYWDTELLPK